MGDARHLEWEGCFNARDLGGLATRDGRRTRWGAVVRSDHLDHLTEAGWKALYAHGVRTLLDIRNEDERGSVPTAPMPDVVAVHVPLDDIEDDEFWGGPEGWATGPQFGTPLYYGPFLERKAERAAAAVAACARASPGGVVVHCGGGRDRTGLVAMLLLALAGVAPEAIAEDYELSYERMPAMYAARGEEDQGPELRGYLEGLKTSARAAVLETLAAVDVEARLREGGLTGADVDAVRARLVG